MQSEEVNRVHELRKAIDAVIKAVGEFRDSRNREAGGRETSLAYTKLQEAKMWLGKVLEALGSKLPEKYRDEAKD